MFGVRSLATHPLLESRDFRALFGGDVLVTVAERYFVLTFSWWLLTGPAANPSRLGLLLAFESLPVLAVGVLIGPMVDRWNRKWSMLGSALMQCLVVSAVAILMVNNRLSFPLLCLAAMLLGCLIPVFEGAANAAVSQAVTESHLAAAATMQSSTLEFSNIIAATLSATLLSSFGFRVAVVAGALLYLAGALFLLLLRTAAFTGNEGNDSYKSELKAGLAYLTARPALASFVGVYIIKILITTSLLIFIPMLVKSVLGGAVHWVAVLETLFSLGAIVTALALSLNATEHRFYPRYACALALLGSLMMLLATTANHLALALNVTFMGACVAWLLASSNILFHRTVPDGMKGRFFGILDTLAAAATPLGYACVGVVSGIAHVQGVLVVNGIGLLLLAALVMFIPRVAIDPIEAFASDGLQEGRL